MKRKIFYSWQSDLPNNTNRGLIERAAESAAKKIRDDDSLAVEPVIARDTDGHPGAPNIAEAIFDQIDTSDIFLADVTFVAKVGTDRVPNSNVLVELGYALSRLGKSKMLLVMNTAHGGPEKLPFDLKMLRTITYAADKLSIAEARKYLTSRFQTGFESILSQSEPLENQEASKVVSNIYEGVPGRLNSARHFAESIYRRLEAVKPNFDTKPEGKETDNILIESLEKTKEIVDEFIDVVAEAAIANDQETYLELEYLFELLANRYFDPPGKEAEFYKALAYEIFLLYAAPLVREKSTHC